MSIENIFDEWKRVDEKSIFIKDGIINNSLYNSASLKILSILPSAPDYSESYDFCKNIEEEFFYEFDADENQKINRYHPVRGLFFNLTRWIYAINKISQQRIPLFSDVCCQAVKKYKFSVYLRSSAVVFVNKFKSKNKLSERKLTKIALRDKKLLDRQIKEINSSLIICGGTFNLYKKIYAKDIFEQIDETNFFVHKIYGSKEIRYVYAANNPDAKKKSDEMFNNLLNDFLNENVKQIIVNF